MSAGLHHEVTTPAALAPAERDAMFTVFARCYECVSRAQFEHDLDAKGAVVLLRDAADKVRGFSTQEWFDWSLDGEPVRILFSGDTIIEPQFWGSAELVKGWCKVAVQLLEMEPQRRLFWLLISKGYRTYLYLPLFFSEFIPRFDAQPPAGLQSLLNGVAEHRFGRAYDAGTGLITFAESQGQLTSRLAAVSPGRLYDAHVRYFLERNPRHAEGVELACLTEVSLENTHGLGRRWLGKALRTPVLA